MRKCSRAASLVGSPGEWLKESDEASDSEWREAARLALRVTGPSRTGGCGHTQREEGKTGRLESRDGAAARWWWWRGGGEEFGVKGVKAQRESNRKLEVPGWFLSVLFCLLNWQICTFVYGGNVNVSGLFSSF